MINLAIPFPKVDLSLISDFPIYMGFIVPLDIVEIVPLSPTFC